MKIAIWRFANLLLKPFGLKLVLSRAVRITAPVEGWATFEPGNIGFRISRG